MKTPSHRLSDYMVALIGGAGIGGLIFSMLYFAGQPGGVILALIALTVICIDVKLNP